MELGGKAGWKLFFYLICTLRAHFRRKPGTLCWISHWIKKQMKISKEKFFYISLFCFSTGFRIASWLAMGELQAALTRTSHYDVLCTQAADGDPLAPVFTLWTSNALILEIKNASWQDPKYQNVSDSDCPTPQWYEPFYTAEGLGKWRRRSNANLTVLYVKFPTRSQAEPSKKKPESLL